MLVVLLCVAHGACEFMHCIVRRTSRLLYKAVYRILVTLLCTLGRVELVVDAYGDECGG